MITQIILNIIVCSIFPLILAYIIAYTHDFIAKSRQKKQPKRFSQANSAADKQPWAKSLTRVLGAGFKDTRLLSKKQETHNKWGIAVKPTGFALTYRKLYLAIIILGVIIATVGGFSNIFVRLAGMLVGMCWAAIIIQQGKTCIKAEKDVYDTIFTVLKTHMNFGNDVTDPRSVITIKEWSSADEPQLIADGYVKSIEDDELEAFEKDLPKKDKNGRTKFVPIADFRSTPLSMEIDFPATFREKDTDDTIVHLNEAFGHVTEWVAEREIPDKKHPGKTKTVSGWDFTHHKAYFRAVPPLPQVAMLPKNFDKTGSWDKIKLGRTVSGEAVWDLKTAPMSLVPLGLETPVWVKNGEKYDTRLMKDLKIGDFAVSYTGETTRIVETTPKIVPEETFLITFKNLQTGRLCSVKAANTHIWAVDQVNTVKAVKTGDFELADNSITSVNTQTLYDWYKNGVKAVMPPTVDENKDFTLWQVYSCTYYETTECMCIKVENPTHTFLIAATHEPIVGENKNNMLKNAIPTHNCGSPLAVDTMLSMEDETQKPLLYAKPGDRIKGSNGTITTIQSVSPILMPDECYTITVENDSQLDEFEAQPPKTD